MTFAAYLPVLGAGFIWDDDVYVTENPLLTAPDGLKRIWFSAHFQSQYFPLVYTVFRLEHALWGFHPAGYHLVNLLLHIANALLVWVVLRRLALPGAWFAAAIFALHPVQVESVAWVTELKNTQSTFFYLAALLAWLRFTRSTGPDWRFYLLAFLLYLLALFSKTTACTFPAAMLLVLWIRQGRIGWQRCAQLVPFVGAGVALGLLTVVWEHHNYQPQLRFDFAPLTRVLVAGRALWFYAGKLTWPADLAFSYSRWTINPRDFSQYLWGFAAVALGVFLWRRRVALGRGPLAAVLFFAATLSPVLGFFWLYTFHYSFVADHYQYLACAGLFAAFAAAATGALCRMGPTPTALVQALVLTALGLMTWRQASIYHSPETLWRDTLTRNPTSWMAHNNLGLLLAGQGKTAEAIAHYQDALRLKPDFTDAHLNLGVTYRLLGRNEDAIAEFTAALRADPEDPDALNNLGVVLISLGQYEEALARFTAVLQRNPRDAIAWYNAGNACAGLRQPRAAIERYQTALRLDPHYSPAHYKLANAFLNDGNAAAAVEHYRAALAGDPALAEAHYQLAALLAARRQMEEAVQHYRAAVALKPAWVEALNNLAWLLATDTDARYRDGAQAVQLATRAVALTHNGDAEALDTLAAAYAENAQFDQAVASAQAAIHAANSTNLSTKISARLKFYEARRPYRQERPSTP